MLLDELVKNTSGFSSDTRAELQGKIFIALKGDRVDGHDYIQQAIEKKASAIIVSQSWLKEHENEFKETTIIGVDDLTAAHEQLALGFRKKFNPKVIAIGGSAGKTTTKEFLFSLVSNSFNTIKTKNSQNGYLGIPKTFEALSSITELAIIEVGIDAIGDMDHHVNLVQPNLAVISSIGEEHLNLLNDVETVFAEERKLFEYTWSKGGKCFAPSSDSWLSTLQNEHLQLVDNTLSQYELPFKNLAAESNLSLAVAVAKELGVSEAEIAERITQLRLSSGRGRERQYSDELLVIEDFYNSNPSSLALSLKNARSRADELAAPLHLILGDMFDLGATEEIKHQTLVPGILECHADTIVLVGPLMSSLSAALTAHHDNVQAFLTTSDARAKFDVKSFSGVVMIKGSRGMALEELTDS